MKAKTYTKSGGKSTETTLSKDIFGAKVSHETMQQAIVRSQANLRHAGAKTLTRAEVRGGGRKPWRQKGTGRARFGSSRVPIWRSGGVAHGPTGLQNYQKDMPKAMIKASLRMALSAQAEKVAIIEKFAVSEPKTRLVIDLLEKLSVTGNVIVVAQAPDEKTLLANANVPACVIIRPNQLRTYDVLAADSIIIEKPALAEIETYLGKKTTKTAGATK